MEQAIFAAGCFWGVQYYFDQIPGVTKTIVGYTGGHTQDPTYEEVCTHNTGHAEAVQVTFDPKQVSYQILLQHFFRLHDPTQLNRQGPDVGDSYRSAIFYQDKSQQKAAEAAKAEAQDNWPEPIVTQISPASEFYPAEAYHQKFAERTGRGMCHIPYQSVDQHTEK